MKVSVVQKTLTPFNLHLVILQISFYNFIVYTPPPPKKVVPSSEMKYNEK